MNIVKRLSGTFAFLLLSSAASRAMGWIPGDGGSGTHSAPGPVIGVGLPALVALGGYVWYRRRGRGK